MPVPRLVSASVCLPEMATPSPAKPLPKPACSISQAAGILTVPSSPGQCGASRPSALPGRGGHHRVGEERAHRPGVPVVRVEHHALAGAQLEHGVPGRVQRHPVARLDAEGAGQFGVPDRGRLARAGEPEIDLQHDVPVAVLEDARPVREPALGRRHRRGRDRAPGRRRARPRWCARPPGRTPRRSGSGWRRPNRGCRTGTRRRSSRWSPRRRRSRPTARRRRPARTTLSSRSVDDPDAAGAQEQHGAGETGVADHHVAAAGQHEHRPAVGGRLTYRSDRFVRFGDDRQRAGRAAEA